MENGLTREKQGNGGRVCRQVRLQGLKVQVWVMTVENSESSLIEYTADDDGEQTE